ncbi:MAG: helix-turn-helix transcriptional regulator [Rhodoglobus sp.]
MTAKYLTPTDVTERFGISRAHLAALRFEGKGPRYRKPTPKTILYVEAEVIEWIEASARYGTAAEAV